MNLYINENLKFPLTNFEYDKLDDVFEFINNFYFLTYNLGKYRKKIIKIISKKYKIEEFLLFEKILEKLFWNIRYLISEQNLLNTNNDFKNSDDLETILNELYRDTYYRSFINKLVLIDDINNTIYYKKMEGSSHIFCQNYFNLATMMALKDRTQYEKILINPKLIKEIVCPKYYHQLDYAFPNLNLVMPFIQSDNYRLYKIKLMYYNDDCEKNWYRLLIINNNLNT